MKNINFTLTNLTQKCTQEQVNLDFAKSILEQTPIYININFSLFNNTLILVEMLCNKFANKNLLWTSY